MAPRPPRGRFPRRKKSSATDSAAPDDPERRLDESQVPHPPTCTEATKNGSSSLNWLFKSNIGGPSNSSQNSEAILEAISSEYPDRIIFKEECLARRREPWKASLIGKFQTKSPPIYILKPTVTRIWNSKGLISIIVMENDFYLFRFGSIEEAIDTLTGGPWTILGEALNLMLWIPNFQPLLHKIKSAPIWVRLPDLPLEYCDRESVMAIATKIGRPLKFDEQATLKKKGKFLRVCIEIDLEKPISEGVWIGPEGNEFLQVLSFENVPSYCAGCGCIGHKQQDCLKAVVEGGDEISTAAPPAAAANVPSSRIRVKNRRRMRGGERTPNAQSELPKADFGSQMTKESRRGKLDVKGTGADPITANSIKPNANEFQHTGIGMATEEQLNVTGRKGHRVIQPSHDMTAAKEKKDRKYRSRQDLLQEATARLRIDSNHN